MAETEELLERVRRVEARLSQAERRGETLRRTTTGLTLGVVGSLLSMSLAWQGDRPYLEAEFAEDALTDPAQTGWVYMAVQAARAEGFESFLVVVVMLLPFVTGLAAAAALPARTVAPSRAAMWVAGVTTVAVGGMTLLQLAFGLDEQRTLLGSGWFVATAAAVVTAVSAGAQARLLKDQPQRPARTGLEMLGPPAPPPPGA